MKSYTISNVTWKQTGHKDRFCPNFKWVGRVDYHNFMFEAPIIIIGISNNYNLQIDYSFTISKYSLLRCLLSYSFSFIQTQIIRT